MYLIRKYAHVLRRVRLVHYLLNLRNSDKLQYLKPLYKKAGIRKSVYSSISNRNFNQAKPIAETPWLDQDGATEKLTAHPDWQKFSVEEQEQLHHWVCDGFMVLKNWVPEEVVDAINHEVEVVKKNNLLPLHFTGNRIMNCYPHSPALKSLVNENKTRQLLDFAMGRPVRPFQTMNFFEGSKAKAHADIIHMTTEPLGYMLAIWVALEDIHPDSGPVFYVPGSHKLPYLMSDAFPTGNTSIMVGKRYYENYTEKVESLMEEKGLEKVPFYAKKGDMLVWHANLLHGGLEVNQPGISRNSLVVHYFAEQVICYHELTQRPALLNTI